MRQYSEYQDLDCLHLTQTWPFRFLLRTFDLQNEALLHAARRLQQMEEQ